MSVATLVDPVTDHLLTPQNAALVIIDYQPVQVGSVASMDRRTLVLNVTTVARLAKLFKLPVVITTVNVATGINQPTIHQIADLFPGVEQYDRTTLNAWEDPRVLVAVKATGRKKLIMVALWTEVCLAFPALSALRDGYEVFPVVDAVGGTSLAAHEAGLRRIIRAGAQPTGWVGLACELQRDWARKETVPEFADLVFVVEGK
jgi:nicotinamidase-related amidase